MLYLDDVCLTPRQVCEMIDVLAHAAHTCTSGEVCRCGEEAACRVVPEVHPDCIHAISLHLFSRNDP
jgi:hypothetical protein